MPKNRTSTAATPKRPRPAPALPPEDADDGASRLSARRSAAQRKQLPKYGKKRDLIVAAAGPVLEQRGLQGTTVAAIADAAGLDRATVYYYFPDKFALFREAIHDGLREMFELLDCIDVVNGTPSESLREAIRVVMDVFERHYPYLYIYFREGSSSEVIDQAIGAETLHSGIRYEEVLLQIINEGVRRGEFTERLPAKVTVNLIVGMLNWTYAWYRPTGKLSGRDVVDGMTETLLKGISGPKKPRSSREPAIRRRG